MDKCDSYTNKTNRENSGGWKWKSANWRNERMSRKTTKQRQTCSLRTNSHKWNTNYIFSKGFRFSLSELSSHMPYEVKMRRLNTRHTQHIASKVIRSIGKNCNNTFIDFETAQMHTHTHTYNLEPLLICRHLIVFPFLPFVPFLFRLYFRSGLPFHRSNINTPNSHFLRKFSQICCVLKRTINSNSSKMTQYIKEWKAKQKGPCLKCFLSKDSENLLKKG